MITCFLRIFNRVLFLLYWFSIDIVSKRQSTARTRREAAMAHTSNRQPIGPSSGTTIYDLNDDVLRETFQYLKDIELGAVAEICSSFLRAAQAEFSHRYKSKRFTFTLQNAASLRPDYFQWFQSALRNFGPVFGSIGIGNNRCDHAQEIMELLEEHCGVTLNELALKHIWFETDSVAKLRRLLSRLKVLELHNCRWESEVVLSETLAACSELHTLNLKIDIRDWTLYERNSKHFTKLKSLELDCRFQSISSLLNELAAAQTPLESLQLYRVGIHSEVAHQIAAMRQLKTLKLIGREQGLWDGERMYLDVEETIVPTILKGLTELTHLFLGIGLLSGSNLVEVIRLAPKLCELNYSFKNDFSRTDVDSYYEILKVVSAREPKLGLHIIFKYESVLDEIPEAVLAHPEELKFTAELRNRRSKKSK